MGVKVKEVYLKIEGGNNVELIEYLECDRNRRGKSKQDNLEVTETPNHHQIDTSTIIPHHSTPSHARLI